MAGTVMVGAVMLGAATKVAATWLVESLLKIGILVVTPAEAVALSNFATIVELTVTYTFAELQAVGFNVSHI